ncbi:MAG TPA: phosphate ABC transporter permease [Lentisphaeria bacterium]|nr:MAG: phosphate ABC transporter permease [Lentisphaerae bacterium GWF2_38_69]HBM15549.1 phosphate ABC transporter permease [Lentisphaeria bacterium]
MITIESGKIHRQYIKDLWNYRELFWLLSWRDILVRYKQTVIGIAWSVLRPLLTMIVFTIVFGKLAKMPSEGMPYSILVFSAMLPWQFFSNTLSEGGNSLLSNEKLISKVYFPRIIIPTTSMIVSLIDFLISFALLLILMIVTGFLPSWTIVFMPIFLIEAIVFSLGLTFFISAMNVKYRDFRYVLPFIIQFGLYISPVGFSSSIVPEKWRIFYYLNPMAGIIDSFRWCISGFTYNIYITGCIVSFFVIIIFFIIGILYFRSAEREFADII